MYEGVAIDPQSQSGPGEHHPVAVLSKALAAAHAVGRLTFSRATCARAEEATSRIRVSIVRKLAHYGKHGNVRSPPTSCGSAGVEPPVGRKDRDCVVSCHLNHRPL